ncbi:MAG: 4-(cytidine 5'-diphospho)-2-C-methyl-D-erythritol kinase [Sphaerochaetaceae bacterium]|nr:4-(cytidine 5'-diphospho)-2-C-methyl-D-erythritol kinase [Sphaerochaetaceae bacterium]
MRSRSVRSYAKINIHLDIAERRDDGFHDLLSIFQLVDFYDRITISACPFEKKISIRGMEELEEKSNLMYSAAEAFMTACKTDMSVQIDIEKNIPMKGGLGGGSSNAAAVLEVLNEIAGYPLSFDRLIDIGLSLGSDVPFFLYHAPVAVVEGRGEIITPIEPRDDLKVSLVCIKGEGVSTAEAFAQLDRERSLFKASKKSVLKSNLCQMYHEKIENWSFFNDFNTIVRKYNELYDYLNEIASKNENVYGQLSGSGSTYYFLGNQNGIDAINPILNRIPSTHVTNICVKCLHR